jgi:paraquat-inducible protein B
LEFAGGKIMKSVPTSPPEPIPNEDIFPRPTYQRKSRLYRLVWLIPILAAVATTFYAREYFMERGPLITIKVSSADGLKVGDTPLLHRGVMIGKVSSIELDEDKRRALIQIRLQRHQEAFAKEGATFWTVRPQVSGMNFQGLGTLFSGPYIDSAPGSGVDRKEFSALSKPPTNFGEGLELIVHSPRLEHLEENSPVYYRGEQVGVVRDVRLGREADRVEARLTIWRRYGALVRANSKFWPVSGFDLKGGIFSGLKLQLRSLKALVSGGIAFATPDKDMGGPVKDGTDFALEKESKDEWLNWAPKISIRPSASEPENEGEPLVRRAAERVESQGRTSGKSQ